MFTIAQIKEAHAKVKTGADFPKYIQDLIDLGVMGYETFVADGHVEYFGSNDFRATATETYALLTLATTVNKERFIEFLVQHQEGQTDYLTFCAQAAQCGIACWTVNIIEKTCTYFDNNQESILIEKLPM
ncbi:MAG: DUF1398 domain-containing protein [Flavobacterium sp.]